MTKSISRFILVLGALQLLVGAQSGMEALLELDPPVAVVKGLDKATEIRNLRGKVQLRADESPYVIRRDLVQGKGDTLLIEGGVKIYLESYSRLLLRGAMDWNGTEQNPIEIRAADSSLGWVGLYLNGGPNLQRLTHVRVYHAFKNQVVDARVQLENCLFAENHYALWVEKGPPLVMKNLVMQNNRYGLAVVSGNVELDGGIIRQNSFGVFLENSGQIFPKGTQIAQNSLHDVLENRPAEGQVPRAVWSAVEARF